MALSPLQASTGYGMVAVGPLLNVAQSASVCVAPHPQWMVEPTDIDLIPTFKFYLLDHLHGVIRVSVCKDFSFFSFRSLDGADKYLFNDPQLLLEMTPASFNVPKTYH